MSTNNIQTTRRRNLENMILYSGLTRTSNALGKPKSQLLDMISGRKSFGEKVARQMEENSQYLPLGHFDHPTPSGTKVQIFDTKTTPQKNKNEKLRQYLYNIPKESQADFANSVGNNWRHLLNIAYGQIQASAQTCINLEKQTNRQITCEDLRPDIDWAYIRAGGMQVVHVPKKYIERREAAVYQIY